MNIGFDLDKIFINHPPLVPSWLINKLYGEKSNGHLSYRIPGKLEQHIRRLTHIPLLRPAMSENIALLEEKFKNSRHTFFLISSRFGFLQKETEKALQKYGLKKFFREMHFNTSNVQPHLFKDAKIMKMKIQRFVDDDLPLLKFLAARHPHITFFWLNKKQIGKISKNIHAITSLSSVFSNL